jgi:hypothetical protein
MRLRKLRPMRGTCGAFASKGTAGIQEIRCEALKISGKKSGRKSRNAPRRQESAQA